MIKNFESQHLNKAKRDAGSGAVIRKRIAGVAALVLAVACFVLFMQEFYFRRIDHNNVRLEGFYLEEKDSLDVVVVGASGLYSGWNAGEAYRTQGFTSYPYCFQYNPVSFWKYELRDVIDRQHPSVLVIDVNGLTYEDHRLYEEGSVRNLADSMPMSANKRALIDEMGTEDKLSYYLPIMKYHDVFHTNSSFDIFSMKMRGYAILRGAFTHSYVKAKKGALKEGEKGKKEFPSEITEKSMAHFNEVLDILDESGIQNVLFVRTPQFYSSADETKRAEMSRQAGEIAMSRGYDYLDLNDYFDEMALDRDADFYDPGHMVAPGQRKFTDFFAKYLVEKYDFEPREQSEKQRAEWEKSAEYTLKYYELYDKYRAEHPDSKEQDYNFKDDVKTMRLLDEM